MVAYLLFNDSNQLLLVYADDSMRSHLLAKQSEFIQPPEVNTSSGYSDLTTSPDPESPGPTSLKTTSDKQKANYDLSALSQYFLPLTVLYRTKLEADGEGYEHMSAGKMHFVFSRLHNEFLLLTLARQLHHSLRMVKQVAHMFMQVTCFCFGPVLYCVDDTDMHMLASYFNPASTRLFTKIIAKTLANLDRWMQLSAGTHLDVAGLLDHEDKETRSAMERLMEHYHVFLGATVTLLVCRQKVTHVQFATGVTDCITSADLHLIVLMAATEHRPANDTPKHKPKFCQVWLRSVLNDQRTLYDVFRLELGEHTEFVCLRPADYEKIVAIAERLQQSISGLTCPNGLLRLPESIVQIDKLTSDLSLSFYQYSLLESTDHGDLSIVENAIGNADQGTQLQTRWWTLRSQLNEARTQYNRLYAHNESASTSGLPRPPLQPFTLNPTLETRLRYLSQLVRHVLIGCVDKSYAQARKLHVNRFVTCWKRMNTTYAGGSVTSSPEARVQPVLGTILRANSTSNDSIHNITTNSQLDLTCFLSVLPRKHCGLSLPSPSSSWHRLCVQILASGLHRRCTVLILYPDMDELIVTPRSTPLTVMLCSSSAAEQYYFGHHNVQHTPLKWFHTIGSSRGSKEKSRKSALAKSSICEELKHSFLTIVRFEPTTNVDLAVRQTKILSVKLLNSYSTDTQLLPKLS